MATKSLKLIPESEGKFTAWANHFVSQVAEHPELYHLDAARIDKLRVELGQFTEAAEDALAARDASLAATRHKKTVRSTFENNLRVATKMIQANDEVTDAAREAAGVHVHKTTRTPVPVPSTCPVGFVIASDRLEHTLSYFDSATPSRRAKPAGVTACEVYLFVGDDTPQSPSRYKFLLLSTRTPQKITFKDADAGQTANYLLRWVNTKGEFGPWSQIVSATIPAV